jgi:hypothetical protein
LNTYTSPSSASASAPTLKRYLASLPILDRRVLFLCCSEARPFMEVSDELGISPCHITKILLRVLAFAEGQRDAGVTERAPTSVPTLASRIKWYLVNQQPAFTTRTTSPFADFGSGFADYGAN